MEILRKSRFRGSNKLCYSRLQRQSFRYSSFWMYLHLFCPTILCSKCCFVSLPRRPAGYLCSNTFNRLFRLDYCKLCILYLHRSRNCSILTSRIGTCSKLGEHGEQEKIENYINQMTTLYLWLWTIYLWLKTLYLWTRSLNPLYFTAFKTWVENVLTYALGEHDPRSSHRAGRTLSEM